MNPTPGCEDQEVVSLRPAQAADLEGLVNLIAAAMNPAEGSYARTSLKAHFNAAKDGRLIWVLPMGKEIIGVVGLHHYEWGPPENVWLSWFAVHPSHQKQGLGRRILQSAIRNSRAYGYHKLFIETYDAPEFLAARILYERYGFRISGFINNYLPTGDAMMVYCLKL